MSEQFDVFLCHNSQDKPEVRKIARQLQQKGLKPWLDEWELQPGLPWQRELERQITNIRASAVFVGNSGLGPWQEMEIEAYLRRFVNQGSPVIPVLLRNAPEQPELPIFLEGMTWVDFRHSESNPMGRLIWGITGVKPDVFNSSQPLVTRSSKHPTMEKERVVSPPNPQLPSNEVELKSEKGVDYTKLEKLLKQQKWKNADEETARIMCQMAGRRPDEYLRVEDVENFPAEDLRKIDELWLEYSNNKFGFSIQKKVYQGLGGTMSYSPSTWDSFSEHIGWRKSGNLLPVASFTFDISAPEGHLPSYLGYRIGVQAFKASVLGALFSSIDWLVQDNI